MSAEVWGSVEAHSLLERARRQALPPSQNARARVWSRIERKRVRPARRFAWAAFAAGAVSASLLVLLVSRPRGEGALVIADGGVQRVVRAGEGLPERGELSLIDLHGAGRMVAGAASRVMLERLDAAGVAVRLDRGSLLLHVTPRPKDAPFVVHTPRFTARVVGTVLRVVVRPDGSASLAVGHGAVEVTPLHGAPVRVGAGEKWPAGASESPAPEELERLGPLDLEGTTAADLFAAPAAAGVPAATGAPRAGLATGAPRAGLATGALRAGLIEESALYQAGFRALTEQRDPRAALDIWEEERGRFPRGVLEREVDSSIIDALVALGRTRRALAEIDAYLHAWPDSLKRAELHFVRGTLLRRLDGGCQRARVEFARALEHPAVPWAERARLACRP